MAFAGNLRIPTKPTMHSNVKPATCSDPKPAGVPISCRPPCRAPLRVVHDGGLSPGAPKGNESALKHSFRRKLIESFDRGLESSSWSAPTLHSPTTSPAR
jgi:hypothetical protein